KWDGKPGPKGDRPNWNGKPGPKGDGPKWDGKLCPSHPCPFCPTPGQKGDRPKWDGKPGPKAPQNDVITRKPGEWKGIPISEVQKSHEKRLEFLKKADTNNDGLVSPEEFRANMKKPDMPKPDMKKPQDNKKPE
ncbi:MAG: hypothetical protein Q4C96_06170, partial [Planctomycetia bacterium]|nr:hypothetical protein [Planctomycetia bacterium]